MSQGGGKNQSDANINLVSSSPNQKAGDYSKFYQDYVPMVKNWSNRDEVNAAFTKKYASSYAPPPSAAKSSDASASASAPVIALSASSDTADAQSAPATSDTSVATQTALV